MVAGAGHTLLYIVTVRRVNDICSESSWRVGRGPLQSKQTTDPADLRPKIATVTQRSVLATGNLQIVMTTSQSRQFLRMRVSMDRLSLASLQPRSHRGLAF